METITLFTLGYGAWPTKVRWNKLMDALRSHQIDVLCDIRHSPCASALNPEHPYGPRSWHLQAGGQGIAPALAREGIEYRWLVELGNPQKRDPGMTVLREHLADTNSGWPVHRGLRQLIHLAVNEGRRCCLLCACELDESCHRSLVASAFVKGVAPRNVAVVDLATSKEISRNQ